MCAVSCNSAAYQDVLQQAEQASPKGHTLLTKAKQWTATSGGLLEPVARGKASVGIPRAFVGCARRVAGEHRACLPAGEAHQVTLRTAAGQPVMRERVPKLVGVKLGKADLVAPVLDHLVDAARRESTLLAKPQPGIGRVRMRGTGTDVPVNVACGLGPDREAPSRGVPWR